MATKEAQQASLNELRNQLKNLTEIKIDSILIKESGGVSVNFTQGREYIERLLGLYAVLSQCPLETVPNQTLLELTTKANEAKTAIDQIINFDPNAPQQRDAILNRIREMYDAHYIALTPTIAYASRLGFDFVGLERKAKESIESIEVIKADVSKRLTDLETQANQTLGVMRKAAAEMGVSQQAIYFRDQAKEHKDQANNWLKATVWMGIITILFAVGIVVYYMLVDPQYSVPRLIQLSVAKLFILSVLYYGIIWSAKNYRSHLHNYVVNTHRQNSLSTFKAFVEGTDDSATKNAVLIRSTEAVFSPVNSGYTSTESESQGSPQILEIIRGVTEATKGKV